MASSSRSRNISQDDWEIYREEITSLFLQNQTYDEIINHLLTTYNFKPSQSQLARQTATRWNLKRNLKIKDVQDALAQVQEQQVKLHDVLGPAPQTSVESNEKDQRQYVVPSAIRQRTETCQALFSAIQQGSSVIETDWIDKMSAEFNWWSLGIGATKRNHSSLDYRLRSREDVNNILVNLLDGMAISLKNYHELVPLLPGEIQKVEAKRLEIVANLDREPTKLEEQMEYIRSIVGDLMRISQAIRKSGTKFRHERVDKLLEQRAPKLEEFRVYLTHMILLGPTNTHLLSWILYRYTETGHRTWKKLWIVLKARFTDPARLSTVQARLIHANIVRRNRFELYFRKYSQLMGQRLLEAGKAQQLRPAAVAPQVSRPVPNPAPHPSTSTNTPTSSSGAPREKKDAPQAATSDGSAMSSHSATAVGTLDIARRPQTQGSRSVSTKFSQCTMKQDYPSCPEAKGNRLWCPCCAQPLDASYTDPKKNKKWRGHLAQDLSPYVCIYADCTTPDAMYVTTEEWKKHMKQNHSVCRWICDPCWLDSEQPTEFEFNSEEEWRDHTAVAHKGEYDEDDIPDLAEVSQRAALPPVECPLCYHSTSTINPETDNHISEHLHAFSLQALPWQAIGPEQDSQASAGSSVRKHALSDGSKETATEADLDDAASSLVELASFSLTLKDDLTTKINANKIAFGTRLQLTLSTMDEIIHFMPQSRALHSSDGQEELQAHLKHLICILLRIDSGDFDLTDPDHVTVLDQDVEASLANLHQTINQWAPQSPTVQFDEENAHGRQSTTPLLVRVLKQMAGPDAIILPDLVPSVQRALYDELKDPHPLLRKDDFVWFLQNYQQEKEADVALDRDEYTFKDFTWVWTDSFSLDGQAQPIEKDDSQLITDYFIDSADKPTSNRHANIPHMYSDMVQQGCRSIMIDVWSDEPEMWETKRLYQSDSTSIPSGKHSGWFQTRVDDEHDILTQDYGSAKLVVPEEEPKSRGDIDQDSIITEVHQFHPERQFVLLPLDSNQEPATTIPVERTKNSRRNRRSSGEGFSSGNVKSKDRNRHSSPERFSSNNAESREPEQTADNLDMPALQATSPFSGVDSSTGRTADTIFAPKITSAQLSAEPTVRANLSSRIASCSFREVASCLRGSAFVTSDLPLIIGLKVHLNSRRQKALANIIREAWQTVLLEKQIDAYGLSNFQLPTLAEARNKILIHITPEDSPVRLCDELRSLNFWTHRTASKTFALDVPQSILNLSEGAFFEPSNIINEPEAIFKHNKRALMRVYPSSTDKSKASPSPAQLWRHGVQMVSTNWLGKDHGRILNQGMFNGEEGWVLKPPGYRGANTASGRPEEASVAGVLDLALTFFPSWELPETDSDYPSQREIPRFEVDVDTGRQEEIYRKHSTQHEATDPEFGESFQQVRFSDVTGIIEEFAFVKILLKNPNKLADESLWACIRLSRLRPGFRYLWFAGENMRPQPPRRIFVCITKTFRPYSIATWT